MARNGESYAIRDRLRQKPDVNEPPSRVELTIGRRILSRQRSGKHPLRRYIAEVERHPDNVDIGAVVAPHELSMRIVSPTMMYAVIEHHRRSKKGYNMNARRRENYFRSATTDIREVLREQESQDPIQVTHKDLTLRSSFQRFRANMFEPDVESVEFDDEDNVVTGYDSRGEAFISLKKRPDKNGEGQLVLKPAVYTDDHTQAIAIDDAHRINEAFNSVGLSCGKMGKIVLDQFVFDIPVVTFGLNDKTARSELWTPLTPMGDITVQPLAIWEGQ